MRIMKKLTAVILIAALTVSGSTGVFASDTATVVTFGNDNNTGEQSTQTQTGQDSTQQSGTQQTAPAGSTTPYLALGADLNPQQLATVTALMGLAGTDISNYNVVYVTNAEEHQYLDSYISPSVIGTKSLSSVLVRPAESGHGITVTTQNITYCTEGMYRNALLTAGVENADIMVVGPSPISGTAALIGALKAYADMTDTTVNEKALDTSLNEIVTTGQIEEALDGASKEDVESMIAFIKAEIAGKELNNREEIEAAVRQAIKDYGGDVTLDENEIKQIVDLMVKIKDLGLDYNTLLDQASDLYAKFGDKLTAEDIAKAAADGVMAGFSAKIKDAFSGIAEGIKSFFSGLFNR
ncbi:MAG: DUF1002 domain-containing protein [Lachnospiraceae bacterium]|nr:DUF1002 domain-containing protein [Lachnospiraceae bacterium]